MQVTTVLTLLCKVAFVTIPTYILSKTSVGEGVLSGLSSLKTQYFSPPDCVACFKSIDIQFFRSLLVIEKKCKEALSYELEEFGDLDTTSYFLNICKEDNEAEFKERMKLLEKKGKKVLVEFAKCVRKTLEYSQKDEIRELEEEYRKRRKKCGDENHMENALKVFAEKLPGLGLYEIPLQLQSFLSDSMKKGIPDLGMQLLGDSVKKHLPDMGTLASSTWHSMTGGSEKDDKKS